MSIQVLRTYRFQCDATLCPLSVLSDKNEVPDSWTVVASTAHQRYGSLPSVKSGSARLRALTANGVQTYGRFTLHLCPEHPNAVSEHRPRTDGVPSGRVVVSCSCGARLGETTDGAQAIWLAHFETSFAGSAQEQTPPIEGDQVT